MRKKQFYQLSELVRNTEIYKEDFEYIVENFKEALYLKVFDQPMLIVSDDFYVVADEENDDNLSGWAELEQLAQIADSNNTPNYNGLIVGRYSGLIRLNKQSRKDMLRRKTVTVNHVILDDTSGLKFISNQYPFKTPLPNSLISGWLAVEYSELESSGLEAFFIVDDSGELDAIKHTFVFENLIVPDFQVEDIKALLDIAYDIDSGGLQLYEESEEHEVDTKISKITVPRGSDLTQLLSLMIGENLGISAKGIWAKLENEVEIDEGDRLYDKYNILRSISGSEIYWVSRYGNDNYFKFASIGPTVSKIKKSLKSA